MHARPGVRSYEIERSPAPSFPGGIRVVVRDGGRTLDLIRSPSSAYLLPDLADFSLVKQEAGLASAKGIMLCGETLWLERFDEHFAWHPQRNPRDWPLVTGKPLCVTLGVPAPICGATYLWPNSAGKPS